MTPTSGGSLSPSAGVRRARNTGKAPTPQWRSQAWCQTGWEKGRAPGIERLQYRPLRREGLEGLGGDERQGPVVEDRFGGVRRVGHGGLGGTLDEGEELGAGHAGAL